MNSKLLVFLLNRVKLKGTGRVYTLTVSYGTVTLLFTFTFLFFRGRGVGEGVLFKLKCAPWLDQSNVHVPKSA